MNINSFICNFVLKFDNRIIDYSYSKEEIEKEFYKFNDMLLLNKKQRDISGKCLEVIDIDKDCTIIKTIY